MISRKKSPNEDGKTDSNILTHAPVYTQLLYVVTGIATAVNDVIV